MTALVQILYVLDQSDSRLLPPQNNRVTATVFDIYLDQLLSSFSGCTGLVLKPPFAGWLRVSGSTFNCPHEKRA